MRYYLIAGEASGDLHGSNLIRGLKAEDPAAEFRFWGGDAMLAAAAVPEGAPDPLVRHYRDGAVMGFWEVLTRARTLLRRVRDCEEDLLAWRPDAVILIDYPGFNFKIAKFAHDNGLKVFWYIAPKTWASRERRNRKLKAWVDRLFIVFPFEQEYFRARGVPFVYAGNPLLDAVDSSPALQEAPEAFFRRHGLAPCRYVALLAGSRGAEIRRMMPVLMAFADRLRALPGYGDCEFILAGAPARSPQDYLPAVGEERRPYVHLVFGDTYGVLRHAGAAVINSGTASLEAALVGTPQVVGWNSSALTVFLMRHIGHVMDHIKYISLGNLILDRLAFRELVQEEFTPAAVTDEVVRLLGDDAYRARMLSEYGEIRKALGTAGASRAVAAAMIAALKP